MLVLFCQAGGDGGVEQLLTQAYTMAYVYTTTKQAKEICSGGIPAAVVAAHTASPFACCHRYQSCWAGSRTLAAASNGVSLICWQWRSMPCKRWPGVRLIGDP